MRNAIKPFKSALRRNRFNRCQSACRSAFALLLAMILLVTVGGAVLGGQALIQQRLRAAAARQANLQKQFAAESAVRQILNAGIATGGSITTAVATVPLTEPLTIALAWEPVMSPQDMPPGTLRLRAEISAAAGQKDGAVMEYLAWPHQVQWTIVRRPERQP